MRGGYIGPDNSNKFWYAGQGARYWSSRALSDANYAYVLDFDGTSVYPSRNRLRYYGYSLRCLIPTP